MTQPPDRPDSAAPLGTVAAPLSPEAKDLLGRFESLWPRQRPAIDEFLAACPVGERLAVLIELAHADLEFRLRAGELARVEDYLARFPELAERPAVVADLLAAEFRLRCRRDPAHNRADYLRRFPDHAVLIDRLAREYDLLGTVTCLSPGQATQPPAAAGAPTPASVDVPGHEVLEELGRGGMGIVYKARQTALNRVVALKMILGSHAGAQELARFRSEAAAVARLLHPNIVQIYEIGDHAGQPYFTLEFVAGGSLAGKLQGAPLAPRAAAELARTLAEAVEAAHRAGVIHRDLKPANVLLTPQGVPKITDFGLAKQADQDSGQTQSGAIMGTPSYMAPEQAAGLTRQIGPACDVYALGAVLYECLTGRPPFRGVTLLETLEHVRWREPVPPSRLEAQVPGDLETICLKCLHKEPRKRYATAQDLADDLRRFLDREPIRARPVGRFERVARWCRRKPALASLGAALVLAVVVGLAAVLWQWRQAVSNYEEAETQRGRAVEQKGLAEENERQVRQESYVANLNLAWQSLDAGRVAQAIALLEGQKPPPGRDDLRGFEWHCLWRLCHGESRTVGEHPHRVIAVAFSPDGQVVASGSRPLEAGQADGAIKLWDAATGRELTTLPCHGKRFGSLAFSPDGTILATSSKDGTVTLRDRATLRPRGTYRKGADAGWLVFSPDGKWLANGGSSSGTVTVWDPATGRDRTSFGMEGTNIHHLAFFPGGKVVAVATASLTIRLWDLDAGKELPPLRGLTTYSNFLAISPDGGALAAENGHEIKVWDLTTGKDMTSLKVPALVHSLAFSPDSRTLAAGCGSNRRGSEVHLWDTSRWEEKALLRGHTDEVWTVAFAPDGRTLVSGSADRTVKLWDVPPQPDWAVPRGHNLIINPVAVSRDGRTVASGSNDRTVKLWDLDTGEELATLRGHQDSVSALAFSPDGRTLASGGYDHIVKLWDLSSRSERATLTGHQAVVMCLSFSPDGKTLASASTDGTARLWDLSSLTQRQTLKGHTQGVAAIFFSRDGSRLVTSGEDQTIRLWDAATGEQQQVLRGHRGVVWHADFSPDGLTVASAGEDKTVKLWDLAAGRERATLRGHAAGVAFVAFTPDGKSLATSSPDSTLRLWDSATGKEQFRFEDPIALSLRYTHLAFSPDGQTLVAGAVDWLVRSWDLRTRRLRQRFGRLRTPSLVFTPDGKGLAGAQGRMVKLWDLSTGRQRAVFPGGTADVMAVAVSPDGRTLAAGDGSFPDPVGRDNEFLPAEVEVRLWDLPSGRLRCTLKGNKKGIFSAAFSPDGATLASAEWEGAVRLWDVASGSEIRCLKAHPSMVRSLAFSPDGTTLATASGERWANSSGEVKLWDVAGGKERLRLEENLRPVLAAAFSPDGRTVASGGEDSLIKLWDAATGEKRATLEGHDREVRALAFSPDGKRLASAGSDNTVRLWEPATGKQLATLRGYVGGVWSLAFSPDGSLLATGCGDWNAGGPVKIWSGGADPALGPEGN